jgi:protoporphyrinogen oxidase
VNKPHVVVLGGGPAGCGAALRLRQEGIADVTVVERSPQVGGNAGSFLSRGQFLDHGSHRLHSACEPEILQDIQDMLGEDLALRDRNGRIRLRGKWVRFPLKASDLLLRLDRTFAFGAAGDIISRNLFGKAEEGDTFASVLRANLGKTLCEKFYFPYARKLWGDEPENLSGVQAHKRVSAGSLIQILKRLVKPPGGGRFFYPRNGFGQITEAYARESINLGAEFMLGWAVEKVVPRDDKDGFRIDIRSKEGELRELEADHIWSTIPVTLLCRMMSPQPPVEVLQACESISYRAMILVYLTLPVDQFTTTDAHYFPEGDIRMTRMSEPKNYFGVDEPEGLTTLCAELPCAMGDDTWNLSDVELGELIQQDLARAGLPQHKAIDVFTRRLPQAYPVYTMGYESYLNSIESWVEKIPGLLVYGRQGLFAHDNTHHALFMAYSAARCFEVNGGFNLEKWAEYRRIFETHVVED